MIPRENLKFIRLEDYSSQKLQVLTETIRFLQLGQPAHNIQPEVGCRLTDVGVFCRGELHFKFSEGQMDEEPHEQECAEVQESAAHAQRHATSARRVLLSLQPTTRNAASRRPLPTHDAVTNMEKSPSLI